MSVAAGSMPAMDDIRLLRIVPDWIDEVPAHRGPVEFDVEDRAIRQHGAAVLRAIARTMEASGGQPRSPALLADWFNHLGAQAEQQAATWLRAASMLRETAGSYASEGVIEAEVRSFTFELRSRADAILAGDTAV